MSPEHSPRVVLAGHRTKQYVNNKNVKFNQESIMENGIPNILSYVEPERPALDPYEILQYFYSLTLILVAHSETSITQLPKRLFVYICRFIATFLCLIQTLTFIGSINFVLFPEGFDATKVNSILISLYLLYGLICLIFMIYWQKSGYFKSHAKIMMDANKQNGVTHYRLNFYIFV